jgi:hypothetical protein
MVDDNDADCASATDAEDFDDFAEDFDDGEDDAVDGDESDLDALGAEDDEDVHPDEMEARPRVRGRRRQKPRRHAPCSCPQCFMDDEMADEDSADATDDDGEDDESDLDDLDELVDEDDEEDQEDALDAMDARRRRGRGRRRRRRSAPCSCPQCLMDDEMADEDRDDDADDVDDLDDDGEGDADESDVEDVDPLVAEDNDDLDAACSSLEEADDAGDDELDDDDELDAADDESDDDDESEFDDDDRDFDEALEDEDALDDDFEAFDDAAGDLDDEQDAREPVFKGFFSDRDKQNIRAALRIAQTQAARAKSVFDRIGRTKGRKSRISAFRNTPFVARFFGRRWVTTGEIRRVRRRVRKLERILRKRRIRFNRAFANAPRCRTGSSAFTTAAGGIRRLYICPTFLTRAPSDMARTIIHELVHEIGFCHYSTTGRIRCTKAGARTEGEAAVLAARHPMKARKNPQNYVWLFDRFERNRVR